MNCPTDAKGAVVWLYQKRQRYMIVKAAYLFEMQSKADAFSKILYFLITYDKMKVKEVV